MQATITIRYQPLKSHQRTGGPDRPWVGETKLFKNPDPIPDGLDSEGRDADGTRREYWDDEEPDRTGTCRAATFEQALQLCRDGLLSHFKQENPVSALAGMTQERWDELTPPERDQLRDLSGLTPQLVGLEGWRVEVETTYGETRRFIVGKSTGWRPCHLEIPNRASSGGGSAERTYQSVRKLYNAREGGR